MAAQIPSEALLAYTSVMALIPQGGYLPARWMIWAAAIVICMIAVLLGYLSQRRSPDPSEKPWHKLPYLPMVASAASLSSEPR